MNSNQGLRSAKTIDVHAHAVLAETMLQAGAYGPEIGYMADGTPWFRVGDYRLEGVRYEGSPFMNVRLRLEQMDRTGIDFQILSPNPLTYFHFIESDVAAAFCRAHNDALSQLVSTHPIRLAAFAALPMQDISAACEELERAVRDLGMLGAYIGTDFGRPLNSPDLDLFYEKLVSLDVPLFIHPAPAGIDGPPGDPNLKQFDLELLCGFPAQETIAVATLIYGGVLHRHPKLDICISHAGGAVASLIGRLNQACVKRAWMPEELRHDGAFEETLSRLWFDTHVHDARVLAFIADIIGTERLVLGTNFAGWDQHAICAHESKAAAYGNNARSLLHVHG